MWSHWLLLLNPMQKCSFNVAIMHIYKLPSRIWTFSEFKGYQIGFVSLQNYLYFKQRQAGWAWYSLVEGDEGCVGPSGKLLCVYQTEKNYAVHAWHCSILVWLLGQSSCSFPSNEELHGLGLWVASLFSGVYGQAGQANLDVPQRVDDDEAVFIKCVAAIKSPHFIFPKSTFFKFWLFWLKIHFYLCPQSIAFSLNVTLQHASHCHRQLVLYP